jgi:type III pantothenate kinase
MSICLLPLWNPLVLAVDVGNTRTKFGLYSRERNGATDLPVCDQFLAVPHGEQIPWETLKSWSASISRSVVVAGSNPARIAALEDDFRRHEWSDVWTLTDRKAIRINIDVDAPEKVGADRLLNAVAANFLRPANRAAIIIDTGTAATVDLVAADGRFCGGAILPGFALSAQALHHSTALLPLLSVRELANDPPVAVGRNTADAIRSGIYWGHAGALKEVITQICRQQGLAAPHWDQNDHAADSPWLLLTGGGAPFLEPVFPLVRQVPSLALSGLVLVARNRPV